MHFIIHLLAIYNIIIYMLHVLMYKLSMKSYIILYIDYVQIVPSTVHVHIYNIYM